MIPHVHHQSGFAYVGLLFVLIFCFTLGMAFLANSGAEYGAIANGIQYDKATYLAEAAARHAIWRLEHDCNFAPDSTVYYLHDLDLGRYGYNINYTQSQGIALVAAFGLVGEQQVEQSYVVPLPQPPSGYLLSVYGDLDTNPKYRRYDYTRCSGSWGTEATATAGGASGSNWVALAASPVAERVVAGVIDNGDNNKFTLWNGSSWGNAKALGKSKKEYRALDVAIMGSSGDVLILARDDNVNSRTIRYHTFGLLGWSLLPATAFTETVDEFRYVTAASKPSGNDILIGSFSKDLQIFLHRWNGLSFSKLAQLENAAPADHGQPVAIAYEQSSGDALVVWGDSGATTPRYRTYVGTTLSAEQSLPTFGGHLKFIRMVPKAGSNQIALVGLDTAGAIHVCLWDGAAWGTPRTVENAASQPLSFGNTNFDIAYEAQTGDLLAVWAASGSNAVSFLSIAAGADPASGSIQTGPNFLDRPYSLQLTNLPGSDNIILVANSAGKSLRWTYWNGTQFNGTTPAVLKSSTATNAGQPMACIVEQQ